MATKFPKVDAQKIQDVDVTETKPTDGQSLEYDESQKEYRLKSCVGPGESKQAVGYYVSHARGTTKALGADGSFFNPFDDCPEAIQQGIDNGDDNIVLILDTRDGHNYGTLTIPAGETVTVITYEPLWSDSSAFTVIFLEQGANFQGDGLTIQRIAEGNGITSATIRLEECILQSLTDYAGTGLPSVFDIYLNNTGTAHMSAVLPAILNCHSYNGTLIGHAIGDEFFICLSGLNGNNMEITDVADPTDDQSAATKKYVDELPESVQGGEVAGPVTTTSGTFVLAGTITKTTVAGDFKLTICAELLGAGISAGFTENSCEVEVRLDGTPILTLTNVLQVYSTTGGIKLPTLTASSHDITFWIRRTNGGTVGVQNMRACLQRVVVS